MAPPALRLGANPAVDNAAEGLGLSSRATVLDWVGAYQWVMQQGRAALQAPPEDGGGRSAYHLLLFLLPSLAMYTNLLLGPRLFLSYQVRTTL